jgi:phage tail-like protein
MSAGLRIPLHVFRFQVDFMSEGLTSGTAYDSIGVSAAFAECTGLEATMEPKAIKEGGMNYGVAQRAGPTSFATVILKRGISANADLFNIFMAATTGLYAPRMQVTINVFDIDRSAGTAWRLDRAMPVKYKFADLNARGGGEVGIEELHLVHEGLWATTATALSASDT